MKNSPERINNGLNEAEEWISELDNRVVGITAVEQKKKRMKRNKGSLRYLWDNIKHTSIHIIEVPEGERERA